ncbi:hypothetical protein K2173_028200 [Erythroxylum novogranatense]|uniref:Uncharacterized protein n=1 Tax=Erythroxylum novogranatense TaxID=1862640 RepID=A0AAV8U1F9_9ROSI|nr:hypothetical protein K2173_028200 [Erythroxylum novogranatense]
MRKPGGCEKKMVNKGAWTKQEDQKLIDYVREHGKGCWSSLPQAAGLLRCGKSCRLRWVNYLRPNLKRGNFDEDEEELIVKLHALLGNRWSLIAGRLPGRTDNEVKNYWNTHMRRKLLQMGIDPNNHRMHQFGDRKCHIVSSSEESVSCLESTTGSENSKICTLPDLNLDVTTELPVIEHKQLHVDRPPTRLLFGKLLY